MYNSGVTPDMAENISCDTHDIYTGHDTFISGYMSRLYPGTLRIFSQCMLILGNTSEWRVLMAVADGDFCMIRVYPGSVVYIRVID
jgi:hypothetical protein